MSQQELKLLEIMMNHAWLYLQVEIRGHLVVFYTHCGFTEIMFKILLQLLYYSEIERDIYAKKSEVSVVQVLPVCGCVTVFHRKLLSLVHLTIP